MEINFQEVVTIGLGVALGVVITQLVYILLSIVFGD